MPDVFIVLQQRILDLSGLVEESQILAVLDQELQHISEETELVLLAQKQ